MSNLWIDIETMPVQDVAIRTAIRAGLEAPSNYKDPDKIRDYISNAELAVLDKTALDGLYGEVIAIAFGWDDGAVTVLVRGPPGDDLGLSEPEQAFIGGSMEHIAASWPDDTVKPDSRLPVTFSGWNVAFDVRFLWKRCIKHGLRAPWIWPMNVRFPDYNDPMELWAGRSSDAKALGKVAPVILGTGKVADSKTRWQHWLTGNSALVAKHARADLEQTRDLWHKMLDA